jgi:hypothetical protein
LLVTPSAIRAWWGAARAIVLAQENGAWAAAWGADEDRPDYPHRLTRSSGFGASSMDEAINNC